MSIFRGNYRIFVVLALMACVLTVSAANTVAPSQQLSIQQEVATVGGGFGCDFNDGVGVGLGVATLFGCVWCGAGAAVAGIIHVIAC